MRNSLTPLIVAYAMLIGVMFILPFFSVPNYSIISNTTSQLGGQGSPNAWVMNAMFFVMGITSIVAGWKVLQPYFFHKVLLIAFGMGLIGAGVFHHAPMIENYPADMHQDKIHSVFASITGFAFTVLAIAAAFIVNTKVERVTALIIGINASLLSYLMFQVPEYMGLFQRIIFTSAFGWMIWFFNNLRIATSEDR